MLEAQGEATRPDSSNVGYDALMAKPKAGASSAAAAGSAGAAGSNAAGGAAGDFMEVPLKRRKGPHANAYGYKIKVFTADKLNAGLGNTTVRRGCFACVDIIVSTHSCRFSLAGCCPCAHGATSLTPSVLPLARCLTVSGPPAAQVHVELLGRDATVSQALPKGKGSFARGCADRFTLYSHAGDMGQLLALKVQRQGAKAQG